MKNKIRFYLGLGSYVLAWILPLSGFLVARLNLSPGVKAASIGLVTLGIPELLVILAVVCLGKENLIDIKEKLLAWLELIKPPGPVSRWRYRVGLVMFLLPLIPIYIMAYMPQWLPDQSPLRLYVNLAATLCSCPACSFWGAIFGTNSGPCSSTTPGPGLGPSLWKKLKIRWGRPPRHDQ